MDGNYVPYNPRTVEEIYKDFKGRRSGMIKALTNDADDFYQQCDPEKENLCLYGFPNEHWEVNLPAEEIPPELPEPCLGINFARNGMREEDWLSLVAVHSDAWLISVAFYFGTRFGFDRAERKRLFDLINDLPTIFEVVTRKQNARMGAYRNNNNNSSVSKVQVAFEPQFIMNIKGSQEEEDESFNDDDDDNDDNDDDDDDDDDEHADALCGACGANYGSGEFWICCDVCEKWFHGKCVKVTPARAEHIKQYKCPSCSSNKKSRPF